MVRILGFHSCGPCSIPGERTDLASHAACPPPPKKAKKRSTGSQPKGPRTCISPGSQEAQSFPMAAECPELWIRLHLSEPTPYY